MDKLNLFNKLINKKRVSLFVDAANILYSQQSLGWKIDYKKLIKYFKKKTIPEKQKTSNDRKNIFVNYIKILTQSRKLNQK